MGQPIQFRRGNEVNLPSLQNGEPAVTSDTGKLFYGTPQGNIEVATAAELADIATVLKPLPNGANNTTQINTAIQNYDEVILAGGEFYVEKVSGQSYFVKMLSNKKLIFRNGAKLKIKNTNANYYQIIQCFGVDNFDIVNPYVIGDFGQNTSSTGMWGEGIAVYGCKKWNIYNMRADDCYGNGLMIADYKPNGDESVIIKPENGYVDYVHVENSLVGGVALTSGINVTIDEIYAKNISQHAPYCALDIETDFHYSVLKNINIGKVTSIDCVGGVDILPAKYKDKVTADQISINIGDVIIENKGKFRIIGLNGGKINGYINVNNVICYNTDRVFFLDYVPPEMTVHIKNIVGQNSGVLNDADTTGLNAPIYIENTLATDYMRNVTIDNIDLIEKPTAKSSLFLKDAFTGTIDKKCVIKNIRATKPIRVHTKNSFDVKGEVKLNAVDLTGQSWFTHHFWGTHYHNTGASADKILSTNSFVSGFKQTIEVTTEGKYVGITFTNTTVVYPTSLSFVHGFKSNKLGSKISFIITKTNEVIVTEILGTWESVTLP